MRLLVSSKPYCRPLRPPNIPNTIPYPRSFTRAPSLLRLSPPSCRPQLPFLAPPTQWHPVGQWHVTRFITTEKKRWLRKNLWDFGNAFVVAIIAVPTFILIGWWTSHEMMEHDFHTPQEWTFRSRCYWHTIKVMQDPSITKGRIADWFTVGRILELLLRRLEDPNLDGNGLVLDHNISPLSHPTSFVSIDLRSIYNLDNMPEPARRAYYYAFLEAAKTAVAAEKIFYDTKTKSVLVDEWIAGPSNPDPIPLPKPWAHIATPLEEDCIPFFPSAELLYQKMIATRGFTDAQRIETLISYGEWLDLKGRLADAETQFKNAISIAEDALPNSAAVLNTATGVIHPGTKAITENILNAVTAFAVHKAQRSSVDQALPIMLSLLQAYRSCPTGITEDEVDHKSYKGPIPSDILLAGLTKRLGGMFSLKPVEYPPAPPSGNEPFFHSQESDCKEAATMIYAAELLFVTSTAKRETSLSWIKEALAKADAGVGNTSLSPHAREECNKCISVALSTWFSMIQQMKAEMEIKSQSNGTLFSKLTPTSTSDYSLRWRKEEKEHWNWLKKVERDDWKTKIEWEQWKLWSWYPMSILDRVV